MQAIALEYLRHGAKVSISHLGEPKEDTLLEAMRKDVNEIEAGADKTRFITVSGDISQPETGKKFVAETVEVFGRLDVFVSNAGVCQFADFLESVSPPHPKESKLTEIDSSPRSSTIPSQPTSPAPFSPHKLPHARWH
jgi:NAD(P)-dependent dehydrogenase (short-subunit alcohol dehydrogenase family)